MAQSETHHHRLGQISWLRAAVLGANDGIISTASLIIGVAAAHTAYNGILVAGSAALFAGAMSMAAGEYVSVSSQADTEKAELEREKYELEHNRLFEIEELAAIYVKRGLEAPLAKQVALQLMAHDALGAHARDELGLTEILSARPVQAALFSAVSFTVGAFLPLLVVICAPTYYLIPCMFVMAIVFLALLGGVAAKVGGSKILVGVIRVTLWGTLAMLLTAGIGNILGTTL